MLCHHHKELCQDCHSVSLATIRNLRKAEEENGRLDDEVARLRDAIEEMIIASAEGSAGDAIQDMLVIAREAIGDEY